MYDTLVYLGVAAGLALAAYFYYLTTRLDVKRKNKLICCMVKVYSPKRVGDIPADIAKDCSSDDNCQQMLQDAGLWDPNQIPTQ